MWKAFDELEAPGWTGPARPKMFAVQAAGCAPIVKAFGEGADRIVLFNCATGLKYPMADDSRWLDRNAPIDFDML